MTDAAEQYKILTQGFGAVWLRRDVLHAKGEDVISYLQGQLSQDIEPVKVGDTVWSWLLQPHGKVDALIRLTRTADTEFIIDVDTGFSDLVLERLNRFKLRTKVDFVALPEWKVLGLRGENCEKPDGEKVGTISWPGFTGYNIYGTDPQIPTGGTLCDYEVYESTRIENGVPRMGAELDQLTIPAEAGINAHTISFTKGCYTGQELVARIDSRGGNVPRNLRVLVIDSEEVPPTGSKVVAPGNPPAAKPFGTITSSAYSTRLGKSIALALVRREVQPGASALVLWDAGPSNCTVEKPPV